MALSREKCSAMCNFWTAVPIGVAAEADSFQFVEARACILV